MESWPQGYIPDALAFMQTYLITAILIDLTLAKYTFIT